MSKITNKIAALQASLANTASTYFLAQQAILEAEYTFTAVNEDGEFDDYLASGDGSSEDSGAQYENLDVLVSRMASSLRWMNQVQTMLANLMSDYYRDLLLEIARVAKATPATPAAAPKSQRRRKAA